MYNYAVGPIFFRWFINGNIALNVYVLISAFNKNR